MKGSILPALNGIIHVQKENVQNLRKTSTSGISEPAPLRNGEKGKQLTEKGAFCISLQTLFPPSLAVMTKL